MALDEISPLIVWTNAESWIILIVSCVPPIRPLFLSLYNYVAPTISTSLDRSLKYSQFTNRGVEILPNKSIELQGQRSIGRPNTLAGSGGTGNAVCMRTACVRTSSPESFKDDQILLTTKIHVERD